MAQTPLTQATPQSGRVGQWWSSARSSMYWMVATAFLLRLAYILIAHTYRFKPDQDHFSFGYEMGRIARAIATGRGFADPFDGQTGLTAWEPPLYPYLIACVFKLTGVYTSASAFILLTINSVFSALTCAPIFLIGRRCFGEKTAVCSAWAWALLPTVMYWGTRWVWETSLAALVLALIFWLTLILEDSANVKPWIVFGLLWGVAALTNSSLLAFLPASGIWASYRLFKTNKAVLAGVVLASLFFFATISPWLVRNHQVFGRWIFIRSNFGEELRLGNGPGADGTWMSYLHPTQNVFEMRRYQELGELAYVAERKTEALDFIRADWRRFAGISLKRFAYYWAGRPRVGGISGALENSVFLASSVLAVWGLVRAVRGRQRGAIVFLLLFVCYPTIYYFVFPHARYRHPVEPEMAVLIAYLVFQADTSRWFSRRNSS